LFGLDKLPTFIFLKLKGPKLTPTISLLMRQELQVKESVSNLGEHDSVNRMSKYLVIYQKGKVRGSF
jgi:hypothetical protein